MQKRNEIERQLREATSIGVVPSELTVGEQTSKREFQSDERFRDAVMAYERTHVDFHNQRSVRKQVTTSIASIAPKEILPANSYVVLKLKAKVFRGRKTRL
jgi:IS30 family transposase